MRARRGGGAAVGCVVAWLVASACGSNALDVRVTALRDPARTGRTYWLVPGGEGLSPTRLEYRAAAALVHKALRARGYQEVPRDTEPHLVILFGYGVGPPQTVVQTTQGGGGVVGNDRSPSPLATGGGVGPSPRTRLTFWGWTRTEVFSVYTTWVRLSAVDGKAFAARQPANEVWSTTAMTDARGRDLQVLLPVLLASAMDYFAANVRRDVRLLVPPDSQRVEWLARSAP